VQKYERGTNRIAASRLYQLCRILGVRIEFFYDGLDLAHEIGFAEAPAEPFESDPLRHRETIELVEAFYAIGDPGLRRRLFELARAIATGKPLGRPKTDAKVITAIGASLAAGVSISAKPPNCPAWGSAPYSVSRLPPARPAISSNAGRPGTNVANGDRSEPDHAADRSRPATECARGARENGAA
jgi:hypothetical protein